MLEHSGGRAARVLAWAAFGTFVVFVAVVAFAYATPAWLVDSRGIARRLFYLAFCVRTFEMHMALGLIVPLAVLLVLRRWKLALGAAAVLLWMLGPLAFSFVRPGNPKVDRPLRVMTANLLIGHNEIGGLLNEIRNFAPDVLFFQEYTPEKAERLRIALAEFYPHRVEGIREHAFGQAIYSKFAFVSEPELYPHESIREQGKHEGRAGGEVGIWDAQIRAVIEFEGGEIVLQNIHYAPPIHSSYLREQRIMTGWLCDWLATERRPVIIAGDFNCTQNSLNLSDLRKAGVIDTRTAAGRGWCGTWPARGPASVLRVTIDHILTRGFVCEFSAPGGDIASDHFPVMATLGLQPTRARKTLAPGRGLKGGEKTVGLSADGAWR